jgi:hypothetical protein
MLKKRFGESALSSCEVMLRDIAESRRVTRAVQRHFADEESKVLDDDRTSPPLVPRRLLTSPRSSIILCMAGPRRDHRLAALLAAPLERSLRAAAAYGHRDGRCLAIDLGI